MRNSTPRNLPAIMDQLLISTQSDSIHECGLLVAATALRMLDSQAVSCDFCYLDPPYREMSDYEQVLGFLSQSQVLNEGGTAIAEHDKHFDPGDTFGSLRRRRVLRQGDSVLSFYGRE